MLRRWLVMALVFGIVGISVAQDKDDKSKSDKAKNAKSKDDKAKDDKSKDDKAKTDKAKDDKAKTDKEKPVEGGALKLEWKFEKDKPFYQEMSTTTKQTMKVMGMEIVQNQKQTFYFSWTPVKQEGKDWIIKQKIIGVKMDINIGNTPVTYDSTKDTSTANPLADFFKALVGSEFDLTIGPDYSIKKIEGREKFIKNLINANQVMAPMLNQILSDDALKQMADPAFAVVSGKTVKVGDTWPKTSKLNMGPIGTYESNFTYKYEGKEGSLDKIGVKTELKYIPPTEGTQAQLPFKIEKADLKSKEGTGTILFDSSKGRVTKSDMSLTLEGTLTVKIGGTSTEVTISQTQTTNVKTTDVDPLKAPKS